MIVERPPFCPQCQTPELIERISTVSSVAIVSHSCRRCGWKVHSKVPISEPVQMTPKFDLAVSPSRTIVELPEDLDQPAFRFKLTDNGADPLNMRDGT